MSGDELDDAIDAAVRGIMRADPPGDLRQRVFRRLSEPERRPLLNTPRLVAVAALVLLVVFGAFVVRRDQRSAPKQVTAEPPPVHQIDRPPATSRGSGSGPEPASSRVPRAPGPAARVRSAPETDRRIVTATSLAGDDHAVVIAPLDALRSIDADPVTSDEVRIEVLTIEPLQMDPVRVDPLVVNAALSGFEVRMLKQTVIIVTAAALATGLVRAQARPTAATPQAQPAAPARPQPARPVAPEPQPAQAAPRPAEPVGQPVNIRLDITITDQAGPGEPVRKLVTMLMADGQNANVRTSGRQRLIGVGDFPISINVDARPQILRDGSIRLGLGLEYQPRPSAGQPEVAVQAAQMSALNERLVLIVQDKKPLVISQASDPGSDRKITVEISATILK